MAWNGKSYSFGGGNRKSRIQRRMPEIFNLGKVIMPEAHFESEEKSEDFVDERKESKSGFVVIRRRRKAA